MGGRKMLYKRTNQRSNGNMKTKEEVIKEAWGLSGITIEYDECNGWSLEHVELDSFYNESLDTAWEYSTKGVLYARIRPISLQGIEDNNGWTSMAEPIPIEDGNYHMFNGSKIIPIIIENVTDIESLKIQYKKDKFTHYQKIEIPKPPIY